MQEENVTKSSTEQNSASVNATSSNAKGNSGSKKTIVILSIVICVLIVAVAALAISFFSKDDEKEEVTDGRATFVSKDNVEEVREELSKPIEDAYYTTSMTIDWNFYDGTSVSTNAYVENATENKRTVYFDVHLETGELVYSSPYIPVGEKIQEIGLDKDLDAGDYPATVTYHLVDDEHKELTTVSVAITIHVLN